MSVSVAGLVLLTIAYTDQFNFPLKTSEIYQRLIAISIDKKKLLEILKLLADKKLITQKADCTQKAGCTHKAGCTCEVGCWQLRTRLIKPELRWAREKLSQTRWPEVDELSRIIGWIGWVKGIGVTGSLAMKNIRPKSDIDFMIVTQPHRLWVTRLLVMLIIWIVGKRRTRHGAEDDSWCFNLWLDTASMDLPIYKQTIYSAYEVCQAKWVLDKDGTAQEFYQANQWVKVYLPNYYQECVVSGGEELIRTTKKHWSVFYWLWSWLWSSFFYLINLTAYAFQLVYMYPHLTREKVSLGFAYFHPRSTSNVVYQRWYNSLLVLWKN